MSQFDPDIDPNSPEPVFLSIQGQPRAFAYRPVSTRKFGLTLPPQEVFAPGTKAVLFVTNIELLDGEGANAFRVYATDPFGRVYRFPVLDLRPAADRPGVWALTVLLRDELKYWPQPRLGDLSVSISWRGLISNSLLLGYGNTGGFDQTDKRFKAISVSDLPKNTPVRQPNYNTGIKNTTDLPQSISSGGDAETDYAGPRFSADRLRFMEQATFGPTRQLDTILRRTQLETWIKLQFEEPYPSPTNPYPDLPLKSTNQDDATLGCGMFDSSTAEYRNCIRTYYSMYPVQKWFFKEAFYGDAQLRHRVAWALSQIWVVSGVDTQQSSWMLEYFKILAKNAFGNYRDLMREMTLNPAMGNYLDMARSTKNNPNENYPREILQLFTIGLFQLNNDGTLKLDANNNPIPTYDQNTINNFTKVFTGFTFCNVGCPNSAPGIVNYKDPMVLTNTNNHDLTAKTLLNYPGAPNPTIAACTGCTGSAITNYAYDSLDKTLDNIFYHPNVGPFISKQLIQHLVTSDPSPAYVARVAAKFNNNGFGVRGDMKAVILAILMDPEARGNVKTDPNFGKLREPVQFLTNLFRNIGVKGANQTGLSDGVVNGQTNNMAQNTFNSPTVFNYYPPDFVVPGTSLIGPEFGLMTTGTAISRANFVNTMVFNQIGISETAPNGTSLDFSELQALAASDPTGALLVDTLNQRMLHGTMSQQMRSAILTAVTAIASSNPLQRAKQAVYLVATSSQFQVQR
ncbi:MAG TPA: DUF1800 domain-containing protein [Pyrinomonadaceae bacterium]|nr:DUF1800 domain-containing protein [Pyrinomonadaceae bacterium]